MAANAPMLIRALVEGDPDEGVLPAGQVVGRINDMPTCAELIESIVGRGPSASTALAATRS